MADQAQSILSPGGLDGLEQHPDYVSFQTLLASMTQREFKNTELKSRDTTQSSVISGKLVEKPASLSERYCDKPLYKPPVGCRHDGAWRR